MTVSSWWQSWSSQETEPKARTRFCLGSGLPKATMAVNKAATEQKEESQGEESRSMVTLDPFFPRRKILWMSCSKTLQPFLFVWWKFITKENSTLFPHTTWGSQIWTIVIWFLILKGTKFGFGFGFYLFIGLREVVQSFQQNGVSFFFIECLKWIHWSTLNRD